MEKILSEERLNLQKGIIYGPVKSRRLGYSLGINISPEEIKLCSLNCAYCQYSWTGLLTKDGESFRKILPTADEVKKSLTSFAKKANKEKQHIDFLTFSGNGEPTLHPEFSRIVDYVLKISEVFESKPKIACLSNSTTLDKKEIFESLQNIDEPIMKLDAGNEKTFRLLNRPASKIDYEGIVANLVRFNGNLTIQTLFVEGEIDNTKEFELESYMQKLKLIKPKLIQIYSLDRPPAYKRIEKVSQKKLNQIKQFLIRELKLNVVVY